MEIKVIETYILLFFIYSFLGWVWEVTINLVRKKKFINRGFLIGPYCPIYGYGVILITILLKKYNDDIVITFIMSILIAGILEYYTSLIMEKLFNARWWDYTYKKFNINGRVCLDCLLLFGVLACLIIYFVNPFFINILSIFKPPFVHILVATLVIGYITDNITSFKIIMNLKDVSRALKDNTEELSNNVRKILSKKSRLHKRLVYAFPAIDAKVKLEEWKNRLNTKIKAKKRLSIRKRNEMKMKTEELKNEFKSKIKYAQNIIKQRKREE